MPTYEYQCKKCSKKFERLQRMSEAPLKSCVFCRGKVERLIGRGGGFIFKGSGFYITDYKKQAPPAVPDKTPAAKEGAKAAEKKSVAPKTKEHAS